MLSVLIAPTPPALARQSLEVHDRSARLRVFVDGAVEEQRTNLRHVLAQVEELHKLEAPVHRSGALAGFRS